MLETDLPFAIFGRRPLESCVVSRFFKLSLAVVVLYSGLASSEVRAGILWDCLITGEVLSEPELIEDNWRLVFAGVSFTNQKNDFCKDWLEREESISLTPQYYAKLGHPKQGDVVELREFKEENDWGQGLMQWRYFDFGFRE